MTEKKDLTLKESIQALTALINEVLNARNTLKNISKTLDDIVSILKSAFTQKDYDKIFKILFLKSGNTTFYNLYLSRYFKENHFIIEYNTKKDKIFYYGKIEDIKESYDDFKERVRKENQEVKNSMSKKDKVLSSFKALEKLDKESLEILLKEVNERLHKKL